MEVRTWLISCHGQGYRIGLTRGRCSGACSRLRNPGCPFQARLFGLVTWVTCRPGPTTFQATLVGHSIREAHAFCGRNVPIGHNHVHASHDLPLAVLAYPEFTHDTLCPAFGHPSPCDCLCYRSGAPSAFRELGAGDRNRTGSSGWTP